MGRGMIPALLILQALIVCTAWSCTRGTVRMISSRTANISGTDNLHSMVLYQRYRQDVQEILCPVSGTGAGTPATSPRTRGFNQTWSPSNIYTLLSERGKTSPSSFKRIAEHLNNLEVRKSTRGGSTRRPYTARECLNKWAQLAPRVSDLKIVMSFMKLLEKLWPGTRCIFEPCEGSSTELPSVKAIHLLWPWCQSVLSRVGKSVFCDGTFHITIYKFLLVCLTTLDGNHHHRPLMLSLIMESTGPQWTRIFNFFYESVDLDLVYVIAACSTRASCLFESSCTSSSCIICLLYIILVCSDSMTVRNGVCPFSDLYAITSDKEKAIISGLKHSKLNAVSIHVFCSLHAKWSKYCETVLCVY